MNDDAKMHLDDAKNVQAMVVFITNKSTHARFERLENNVCRLLYVY